MFKLREKIFHFRVKLLAYYQLAFFLLKKNPTKVISSAGKLSNVLHVNTFDLGGGAAKVAMDLYRQQKENGINAKLLVGFKKSTNEDVCEIEKLHSSSQNMLSYAEKLLQWQDFFHLSTLKLDGHSLVKKTDIIHLHNLHGFYFSPFALKVLGAKPVIWTLHDMQAFTGHCAHAFSCENWKKGCGNCPDLNGYPMLTKDTTHWILKVKKIIYKDLKTTVVVPSNWLKKKMENSVLSHLTTHVIHNGVDVSIYKKKDQIWVREKLGLPKSKKIVLFSADMGLSNPYKGGEFILQLFSENEFKEILFLNIGSGGEKTTVHDNLWSLPYITDPQLMADYYCAADVFLYPTLADNCPLVILEAMACGLPVLTFETGGVPELVEHLKTGYVANYRDYSDLKKGLGLILENEKLREEFSSNSHERIKNHFTLEIMHSKYLRLYEAITNKYLI